MKTILEYRSPKVRKNMFFNTLFAKLTIVILLFMILHHACRAQIKHDETRGLVLQKKQGKKEVIIPVGTTLYIELKDFKGKFLGKFESVSDSTLMLSTERTTNMRSTTFTFSLKEIRTIAIKGRRGNRIAGSILIPVGLLFTTAGQIGYKHAKSTYFSTESEERDRAQIIIGGGLLTTFIGVILSAQGGVYDLDKKWSIKLMANDEHKH